MAEFSIGDKVIEISSQRKGIIIKVMPARRGRQLYDVVFDGSFSESKLETDLLRDCDLNDPFERCRRKMYGSYAEFSQNNTTFKIQNKNNSTISSLKASRTLFRAYQFKPLLKFLNSDNRRILIADEVGLGKTIEAGHIMLELKSRNSLKNVLIVCPKSLREKWRAELEEKFALKFKIYDDNDDLFQDLTHSDHGFKGIVTYERIREQSENRKSKSFIEYLKENGRHFNLLLCDEAHKMRNKETLTYKGALTLTQFSDAVIFLTATPIMISQENLYNLLHLLDSNRFDDLTRFNNFLHINKPFLQALSELRTDKSLSLIASDLLDEKISTEYTVGSHVYAKTVLVRDFMKDYPVLQRAISRMMNETDTKTLRAQVQQDLTSMSPMNSVFSRTRKREVTMDMSQAERKPHAVYVQLNEDEQLYYDAVISVYEDDNSYEDYWGEKRLTQGGKLGLVQRKRQIASSVYGYMNTTESLQRGIDKYADCPDAKVDYLLKTIETAFTQGSQRKIIIFALFKNTIYYLKIRLNKAGYKCAVIHGDVDDRDSELQKFKTDPNVEILLSSEVGSEGLDMQFCNTMVNYDLPWNPMVVEQRIGRIDRFGQESPVVNIYNFVVKDSIQEIIYERLLERIGIFRSSIGDMEAILDSELEKKAGKMSLQKWYSSLEKEFFCTKLSDSEIARKVDEIAQAIANETENIKQIEEGLTNTLTNDSYFQDQISRILKNKSYVTENELLYYLQYAIQEQLPTCSLVDLGNSIYEFQIPKSQPKLLTSFLTANQPFGEEYDMLFAQFRNRIFETTSFKLTFSQDVAYKNHCLFFVNLYHPLILACVQYFQKKDTSSDRTFRFDLEKSEFETNIESGMYYLVTYQIDYSRFVYGKETHSLTLLPVLFNVSTDSIVEDESFVSEFYGKTQSVATFHAFEPNETLPDVESIDNMQNDVTSYISEYVNSYREEMMIRYDNDRMLAVQQTKDFYNSRKESLKIEIKEKEESLRFIFDKEEKKKQEKILPAWRGQLVRLEQEEFEQLERLNQDPCLKVTPEIRSINLIYIK